MATKTLEPTLDPGDNKQELWGELRPTESDVMAPNMRPTGDESDAKPIAFAIIVGILLVGLAAALLVVRGNSEPSGVEDSGLSEEASIVIGDSDDPASAETDAAPDEDLASPLPDAGAEPVEANPVGLSPTPSIALDDGMATLVGGQPDQQTADRIAGEIAAIVGVGNVTNDFVVDTRASADGSIGQLFTTDSITYVDNSFRVTDASRRQLDLTAYVLAQNPEAVVTITSHSASRGDAVLDVRASQANADRLVVFFSERDIDASRIIAIGLGSGSPIDAGAPELPINNRTDLAISFP